jgi:hypothetical protein
LTIVFVFVQGATSATAQTCEPWWNTALSGAGSNAAIREVAASADGSRVVLGGVFSEFDNQSMSYLALWENGVWAPMPGPNKSVFDVLWYDDGSGEALYVVGIFTGPAPYIARWRDGVWEDLGGGFDAPAFSLAVHDDGTGPALYAAGQFEFSGSTLLNGVARWDGSQWQPVGQGIELGGPEIGIIAMTSHETAQGSRLVVGGRFAAFADETPTTNVAAWDGVSWSPLGEGLDELVYDLESVDFGSGARLFAGGDFGASGETEILRFAEWDGSAWNVPAGGTVDQSAGFVRAVQPFDDGSGVSLYVGGLFLSMGGTSAEHLARYDGAAYHDVGGGADWEVRGLGVRPPTESASGVLYVSGEFDRVGPQIPQLRIAAWEGCPVPASGPVSDLTDDGLVGPADLAAMLGNWGGSGFGDLTEDGVVGPADLALLLGEWGAGG